MREQYPSEAQDRVMVRLPDGMRDQLKAAAKAGNRTMNAEIVARLEFTFAVDVEVQESGYDVGHGADTPEWNSAMRKRQAWSADLPNRRSLEQRVSELEARMAAVEGKKKRG
jgi:hypothetical protein